MVRAFGCFLSPPSRRDINRPHAKLLAAVGLMLGVAVWLFTWVFPVTFMVVMAWSCERDGRHMGRKVRDSYGGEAATTEAANAAARLLYDEGHNWRNLVHASAFALSIALPIAFVAVAIRVRNTRGVNGFTAAGALVALSLVIAITMVANRG